jgi:hypothetical protein
VKIVCLRYNPYDLYIGRENKTYGLPASKWGNPYSLKKYEIYQCLFLYEMHIISSELYDQLDELEGLTLGCWCENPDLCHGSVLIRLYNQKKINDLIK